MSKLPDTSITKGTIVTFCQHHPDGLYNEDTCEDCEIEQAAVYIASIEDGHIKLNIDDPSRR